MRGLKFVAVTGYVLILTYIVLWAPVRIRHKVGEDYRTRFIPFKGMINEVLHPKGNNVLAHWTLFLGNFLGNMVLFMPFPLVMITVCRITGARTIILLAFLTSVALEITQYVLHLGVADVDDVMLNTAGAVIGLYLYRLLVRRFNTQS
ncbi:VanZ family protein [Chitinophaga japonensis]|uniref:VanZ like protein n=1 Tax=Chitinophaga japonensis TaxID=104662 RepID=A0A562T645_CHIJA|nr:VanZ family protein [Chitinophaga japonensis]TWI88738.1 VanZ like protein [Chitinophaga japonensis]